MSLLGFCTTSLNASVQSRAEKNKFAANASIMFIFQKDAGKRRKGNKPQLLLKYVCCRFAFGFSGPPCLLLKWKSSSRYSVAHIFQTSSSKSAMRLSREANFRINAAPIPVSCACTFLLTSRAANAETQTLLRRPQEP